jgi:hypothetical protein
MDDTKEGESSKLRIVDFDRKKERTEANEVVAQMFDKLASRAREGDIEDFVITFKSESKGVESMIGGTIRGFDFIGYIGMLEVLKQRLLDVMSQMTYAYGFDGEDDDEPTPEKT